MDSTEKKVRGRMSVYLSWPLLFAALLAAAQVLLFLYDRNSGMLLLPFTAVGVLGAAILAFSSGRRCRADVIDFATNYTQVQRELLHDLAVPYGVMDGTGQLLWGNRALEEIFGPVKHKDLYNLIPETEKIGLPREGGKPREGTAHVGEKVFHIQMEAVSMPSDFSRIGFGGLDGEGALSTIFLFDETDIAGIRSELEGGRMVAGFLYLDNYDELVQSVEDVRRSLLIALIDRKVNRFFTQLSGVVKPLERDRYLFAFEHRHLEELRADKFSLLEDVKTVNIGNEMTVTLSVGMGTGGDSFARNFEYAQMAIDMALGRGGDQAVLKDGDTITYFGGKSQSVEKSTRVKARVKAHALRELMGGCDRVIAMGHRLPDVDSFGAAVGIYRVASSVGKKAHIVLNQVPSAIAQLRDRFTPADGYPEDLFLTGDEALELADKENTLVVVVDVNRPQITECPDLLTRVHQVVVLDHHRQAADRIEGAVLSYVEPYASSACELVAEILQYVGEGVKLRQQEADAMYAGITVDTNNFLNRTGVRTFEAAAFLRRCGADITRVRKLFRDNLEDYMARAQTVSEAQLWNEVYAIGVCRAEGLETPTVIGAQAANELLDIVGVKASFVVTPYQGKMYISARSIDEINVQLIMERLGGGGHMTIAGAQVEGTAEEAVQKLKETILDMRREGELKE